MKLLHGDCLEKLKELEDESIDLLVTDPPYGYSFMGKDWDKAVPSVEKWKECFRVMKAGSFAFIMTAPRQDVMSHMIVNLEKAGFRTDFTSIYWTYATGFPKAGNIGKMVDKKLGVEREVIGKRKHPTLKDVTKIDRQGNQQFHGENSIKDEWDITAPATNQAKELDGSYAGFQPKPAVEVVLVVMKPIDEKTYVEQALKNGKGITWLDDCRIPYESGGSIAENPLLREQKGHVIRHGTDKNPSSFGLKKEDGVIKINPQGRFPANLLCSDDVLNDGKIRKSTGGKGEKSGNPAQSVYGKYGHYTGGSAGGFGDSGSYSRFFDIDKWWEERLKEMPEEVQKTFPYLIVPKPSKSEKNKGLEDKNHHPTVKPIKLMSYLITLGSREGDTILDPFVGSGTTMIGCQITKRKGIGIEREEEYIKIAEARVEHAIEESKEEVQEEAQESEFEDMGDLF